MSLDKSQALNAAKQHVLQQNLPAAVELYQKIIEDDPADLTASITLGDLYLSTGRAQDAITQFSRVADIYIEHGSARKAITTLKKIIAIDPANTETATKLADLYAEAGLPSEARQHYLQIVEALTRKGATIDALSVFSKVVELDPSNTSTRIKLGELYLREGMNEQAYKEFVTAAEQLSVKGENRRALNAYNEALAIRPDSREALTATHKLMGLLGVAQDKDPRTSPPRSDLSSAFGGAASTTAGSSQFSSHSAPADRTPGSDSFVVQEISKAEILVAYGKVNQALAMLRQVVERQPDNIDVHVKLKDIYLRTGMMTEAARECVALERIHGARGEAERARDYAARASRLTQLIEQPSGDLPVSKRKPDEHNEARVSSAPIEGPPQRDSAVKPRPVVTTPTPPVIQQAPVVITPTPPVIQQAPVATPTPPVIQQAPVSTPTPPQIIQQPTAPPPQLAPGRVAVGPSQTSRMSISVAPSNLSTVEVLTSSDTDVRPVLLAKPDDSAIPMAETTLMVLPSEQSALVPVTLLAADSRERSLPVPFASLHPVRKRRVRVGAAGIAAGVAVLLGASAVIGGFAYDAHLNNQYKELSLAAPAVAAPTPPPAPAEEEQMTQENEQLTVVVTPPTQTDARQPQNSEPEPRREERPSAPQPATETPRIVTPPAPMPPRAIASPDVRGGIETRAPAGIPGAVPIGAASPAEPPPKLVRQSPGVVLGSAIKRVDPGYPATARIAQQSGAVAVEVTINEQGNVTSARALSGPALLRNAAVAAARGWKFKASTLGGVPVTTTTTIVFNFKL